MTELTAATATFAPRRRASAPALWWAAAALLASVACVVFNSEIRAKEASLAATWLALFPSFHPAVVESAVIATMSGAARLAFEITVECTTAALAIPILIISAVLALGNSSSLSRIIPATLTSITIVVVANQLRLAAIILSTKLWGVDPGYYVSHLFTGSLVTLCGLVVALYIVVTSGRPLPPHGPAHRNG